VICRTGIVPLVPAWRYCTADYMLSGRCLFNVKLILT